LSEEASALLASGVVVLVSLKCWAGSYPSEGRIMLLVDDGKETLPSYHSGKAFPWNREPGAVSCGGIFVDIPVMLDPMNGCNINVLLKFKLHGEAVRERLVLILRGSVARGARVGVEDGWSLRVQWPEVRLVPAAYWKFGTNQPFSSSDLNADDGPSGSGERLAVT
jgi:hypothetical protein